MKCAGKRRYGTLTMAQAEVARLYQAQQRGRAQKGKLNAYKCSFCTFYHIGHAVPRGKRARQRGG